MLLNRQQLEQYHRDGYVIIDAPFPRALTEDCLAAVAAYGCDPKEVAAVDTKQNHFTLMPAVPGSYFCALDHSLPFLRVALHPEIVEIARQLEGADDLYFRNGGINELAPGRSTAWHFDADMEYVEFMHYFSGAQVENGCLRVIPGSHRPRADHLQEQLRQARRRKGRADMGAWLNVADVELPGEVPLEVGPDKLIIRSSQIFHATHLNRSPRGRLMHHWLFRKVRDGGFRFHWPDYLTPELITELSPEQRALLRLGHEDPIAPQYQEEVARERGKVFWSVV
ncbi:MAG TPA: phytanoyl-CoA dioxygenase family protein [Chthonomonadaceae bacterium]|nr:phytanoyl-CoA dioxygenase family protein [Chthonomonadaceae bacterium]